MSRFIMAASLSIGLLSSGMAFAQSTMTAPSNSADSKMNPANQPGMADTTSDGGGKTLTGASSDAIGTGNTETHGVMSPEVPGIAGSQGATGANPNNPNGLPSDKSSQ